MTSRDVAAAYDAIAADYDRQVHGDEWMRQILWERYLNVFRPGSHLLDVSCGTGLDDIFLAQHGMSVTGVDVSPGMISHLDAKISSLGLTDRIESRLLDVAELSTLSPESFDGIISAFAGLNTLSDLSPFAADSARLLRPGGRMVLHLLNRFSLWEWLGLLAGGHWAAARGLAQRSERVFSIGGQPVRHFFFAPDEAYRRFFAREFLLRRRYGLGCLRPPHTVERIPPSIASTLGRLERVVGRHCPFVDWGRFFVLELEKKPGKG